MPDSPAPVDQLATFVGGRVGALQRQYADDLPAAVRALAHLRRLDPADPTADPGSWGELFEGFPEGLLGRSDALSWAESSAAASLHLYALHQQGRPSGMHQVGQGLGAAVRRLSMARTGGVEGDAGVIMRFHRLSLLSSPDRRVSELRGLVRMLRADGIGLDYAVLARDLYSSSTPIGLTRVRLRWARDLHRRPVTANESSDPGRTSETPPTDEQD